MRTLLAVLAGALVGAAIGHSQLLCPTGTCVLTGSWMGGGVVGGLMGLTLVGFVPLRVPAEPASGERDEGLAGPDRPEPSERRNAAD